MPRFDIRVVEARHLPTVGSIGLHPNPYCVIECAGSRVQTCTVQVGSCNPTWDEAFKFSCTSPDDPVTITIFDEGSCCSADQRLSTMKLDLTKLNLVVGIVKEDWHNFPHQNAGIRLRIIAHDFGLPPQGAFVALPPQFQPPPSQMVMTTMMMMHPQQQHQQQQLQLHSSGVFFPPPPPPPIIQGPPPQFYQPPPPPMQPSAYYHPSAPNLAYGSPQLPPGACA